MNASPTVLSVQRSGHVDGVRWDAECLQIPGGRFLIKRLQVWLTDEKPVVLVNHRESARDDVELERIVKRVVEKILKRKGP